MNKIYCPVPFIVSWPDALSKAKDTHSDKLKFYNVLPFNFSILYMNYLLT